MKDRDLLYAALRTDFSAFIRRAFATVAPGDDYLHNWHIDAIAYHLSLAATGAIRRLIINMPPRHMKSHAASVAFPAFMLGHDPTARIVTVSYAEELAYKHSNDTRMVMGSDWYRRAFPGTVLSAVKNTQAEFATTRHGLRLATSVGGPLTGRGGNFLIIDDPQKADDGYSDAKRQQVINWYRRTANTRLDNPKTGVIIVVQQRLHEQDLSGVLLEAGGWTHLNLPAIAETTQVIPTGPDEVHVRERGDVLHPERMPLDLLQQVRSEIGEFAFAGQYQQRPAPEGGGIVKLDWFGRYKGELAPHVGDRIIQSWDLAWTASELANYSVCTTWLYRDYRLYLIDVFRKRLEMPDLVTLIPRHADAWNAEQVVLERTGVGIGLLQQFYREQDPRQERYKHHEPRDDKATRLHKVARFIADGRVYLPEQAPWLQAFERELQSFPNGKYDDQVDSLSQALLWLWHKSPPPPPGMFGRHAGPSSDGVGESRVTPISRMPDLTHRDLFRLGLP